MEELIFLHVTDIHCAYDNIERLKKWLTDRQEKIDIVLISGDIADVPLDYYNTPEEEIQEHHDNLKRITLEFLSVSEKVYFVPGNHDTLSYYETPSEAEDTTSFPLNVQSRKVQIAPKLYLFGLGGSVPSFQDGKKLWDGFPYTSDENFGETVAKLLDPILEEDAPSSGDSYIFMTHNGPNKSSTTLVRDPSEPKIIAGSDVLFEYLTKERLYKHTVMNVHGHVHVCVGMSSIGSLSVINPGPLVEGNFGIYSLKMVPNSSPAWKLSSVSIHKL